MFFEQLFFGDWALIASMNSFSGPYERFPEVEIYHHASKNQYETRFGFSNGETRMVEKFDATEIRFLTDNWRQFLFKIKKNSRLIDDSKWVFWLFPMTFANCNLVVDISGRIIRRPKFTKRAVSRYYSIEFNGHWWPLEIDEFADWLDRLDDFHKHVIPT
jgi:hypothetical protein